MDNCTFLEDRHELYSLHRVLDRSWDHCDRAGDFPNEACQAGRQKSGYIGKRARGRTAERDDEEDHEELTGGVKSSRSCWCSTASSWRGFIFIRLGNKPVRFNHKRRRPNTNDGDRGLEVLPIDPWCRWRFRLVARAFCFRPSQPFGLTAGGVRPTLFGAFRLISRWCLGRAWADKEGPKALALLMQKDQEELAFAHAQEYEGRHANRKGGMTDSTWNAYDRRITTPLLRCAPWQRPADAATA